MDPWGVSTWLNRQLMLGYDSIIRFAILSMGEHRVVDILNGLAVRRCRLAVEEIAKDVSEHLADPPRPIEAHVHPGGFLHAMPYAMPSKVRS
jgi:hypothetical protein